jgi:hypothetical protein
MIGAGAFQQTALETITIPASVEKIGWHVFTVAKRLANVTFEKGSKLKSIEYGTFTGAIALETIEIPPSVKTIDPRAFSGATNLKQVTFLPGSNISLIGESAFADTNLKLVVMGKPALDKLTDLNDAARQPLHFGDGNTFYGKAGVSITSMAQQVDALVDVARERGVPVGPARLAASFLTGLTPKKIPTSPKGGRKRATRKGGRKAAASKKKKASRRRKTSRRKAR